MNKQTEGRYSLEVNTAGDPPDAWTSNLLRFDTPELALEYGLDLAMRWTAVRDIRAFDTELGKPVPR